LNNFQILLYYYYYYYYDYFYYNKQIYYLCCLPNIIRMNKSRRSGWAGHMSCTAHRRGAYRVLARISERKRPLGRPRHRWEDNIKMDFREARWGNVMD
jgi:hypothetical protein